MYLCSKSMNVYIINVVLSTHAGVLALSLLAVTQGMYATVTNSTANWTASLDSWLCCVTL